MLNYHYTGNSTFINRIDKTHFSENADNGLSKLANLWSGVLDYSSSSITPFSRISSAPIPNISISQSGAVYTLSASSGYQEYCWLKGHPDDIDDAPPIVDGCYSSSQSIQVSSGSGYYRCYVRNGNNWQSTAAIIPRITCTSCREGFTDETIENQLGINFTVSPNPVEKDFKIEFDVTADDTAVKLEIFDITGKPIRSIVNNIHAKGHFTYPVTDALPSNGTYVCQLMIGEIYLTRKIIQLK